MQKATKPFFKESPPQKKLECRKEKHILQDRRARTAILSKKGLTRKGLNLAF
jgi:hypothetical protein